MRVATSLPAPAPLLPLERSACLDRHRRLVRREHDLDHHNQLRTARAITGPGKHASAQPASDLEPLADGFLAADEVISLNLPTKGDNLSHLWERSGRN